MTKEELRKEVEQKSKAYIHSIIIYGDVGASKQDVLDAYKQGALDFAEPREKRIEELKNALNNAKELLKRLLEEERDNMFWEMNGADKSPYFQVVKQAEQFLKED